MFHMTSQSSRLSTPDAEKIDRSEPQGSVSVPRHSTSKRMGRVTPFDGQIAREAASSARPVCSVASERRGGIALDVEQLGRTEMLVARGRAGLDTRHVDADLDGGVTRVVADVHGPRHAREPTPDLGDHEVPTNKANLGVTRVDDPDAGRRKLDPIHCSAGRRRDAALGH